MNKNFTKKSKVHPHIKWIPSNASCNRCQLSARIKNAYIESIIKRSKIALKYALPQDMINSILIEKLNTYADVCVAFHGIRAIGYSAGYYNSTTAYISLICVLPKYQRSNVGSTLLNACVEHSRLLNIHSLRLEVYNTNDRAIRFYKKNGFRCAELASPNSHYFEKDVSIML